MKQVINSIMYCHLNGIVHRDIKSDNLLFSEKSIHSRIKLIDFGISVKYEKNTKLREKTGTILYIAPEVIQGCYDQRCDIWSCGVLLYTMLCGQPPFTGSSRKEIMEKILRGKFAFRSKIWSLISSEAKDLIEKILVVNVDRRYTCRQILSHPWFQRDENIKINTAEYLENMKTFLMESQLAQAVCTFIVTNVLKHEETKQLELAFKKLDTNYDGLLSREEVKQAYQEAYPQHDAEAIEKLITPIFAGRGPEQSINYTEYLVSSMAKTKLLSQEHIRMAFDMLDIVDLTYLESRRRD